MQDLLYIEDANHKKLFYHFTPAAIASQFVPLIVILDTQEKAPHFEYKMWNVLTPLDSVDNTELLQRLIAAIADEHECEEHIYFYGKDEAIKHAILAKAHGVYTLGEISGELSSLVNAKDRFPIFYLCDIKEENSKFVKACQDCKITLHLDKCLKPVDTNEDRVKRVLDMFEHMNPEV